MDNLGAGNKQHKVIISNRKVCNITGVLDVISFDIKEVLLETEQGLLTIHGNDLHVSRLALDKGEADLDGRIDSMQYSDSTSYKAKGESLLNRLFK